ncbi:uncharacterized protein TM35_000451270 [Trypanosoma theileri]|uniref:Mucin TcMUCII n=1 Tax=Trypanosoma theileri TaxID=67003 RepID=A0A1X0NJN8_9TRYP|nr:uncharacterized protein TM35_000451270 [Trypanosoma theileri]ORC84389.1 hypothetical protein TM35_000451270 [Trypanosoma theileri]
MMMRSVVCLLVFLLSVASVCMEANGQPGLVAEPGGTGTSERPCRTPETTTAGTEGGEARIFTALYGAHERCPLESSLIPRGSAAKGGQGGVQGQVQTDRTGVREDGAVSSDTQHREVPARDSISSSSSGAGQPSTQDGPTKPETTAPTTEAQSPERVNSNQTETQSDSETPPDNSNVNPGNASQNPSPATENTAATNATATTGSEETNTTTPPNTDNSVEAPTTTSIPSVPNAEINTIASTVQKKANVDSSVSPVWMRTAAPLLIVAVLFSATVY